MKKVIVVALLIILGSCQETATTFNGLGELKIGKEFTSLPISKEFTKVMDDEYNIKQFELSSEIGLVSDLNVTTENGKISEVKFTNNEDTNVAAIDELLEGLEVEKMEENSYIKALNTAIEMKVYKTKDKDVFIAVVKYKKRTLKNGNPIYEYSYLSKAAVERNHKQTMKSMGLKDPKQVVAPKTAP